MGITSIKSQALNAQAVIDRYNAIDDLKDAEIGLYREIVYRLLEGTESQTDTGAARLLAEKHGFDLDADVKALSHNRKLIDKWLEGKDCKDWGKLLTKSSNSAERSNVKLQELKTKHAEAMQKANIENHAAHQLVTNQVSAVDHDRRLRERNPHLFDPTATNNGGNDNA